MVFPNFVLELTPGDPQVLRCPSPVISAHCQSGQNSLFGKLFGAPWGDGGRDGWFRLLAGEHAGGDAGDLRGVIWSHHHHALHKVADLPHISRPLVLHDFLQDLGREALAQIVLFAEVLQKSLTKRNDIFLSAAHRGDHQGDDMEAVVQICTESPVPYHGSQILIGSGNETKIDLFALD